MFTLEPELERLRAVLGGRVDPLIARERRDVFSIHPELRIIAWGGAMLVATAAGILLKNNLERIGPMALAIGIALAAAACYAWAEWRRDDDSLVDDYVLLLGALLVSADIAFIETQFGLLGDSWRQHLLLVAVLHCITAYLYDSKMVLSLSIVALAAWLGIKEVDDALQVAARSFVTAALLLGWRELDQRFAKTDFARTFEHFASLLAISGGFALMAKSVPLGGVVVIAVAALIVAWGFRTRSEPFVLYAFVAAVIALDVVIVDSINSQEFALLVVILSTIGAIGTLFFIHGKFKELRA